MNTKFDYNYIKDHNKPGWQTEWKKLLECRFTQAGPRLVENPTAKMFRLGFTVAEIEQTLGVSGQTDVEKQFIADHPEWYLNGEERQDIDTIYSTAIRAVEIEEEKRKIDEEVAAKQAGLFEHDGHKWYPDTLIKEVADRLPDGQTINWKTADKGADGKNIYIEADATYLKTLDAARLTRNLLAWAEGDARKNVLMTEV